MTRARDAIAAFALTIAGLAAATAIVWQLEARAIDRAVTR